MPTKARELNPNPQRTDDARCLICHPRSGTLREDQVWGSCPTNRRHSHTRKEVTAADTALLKSEPALTEGEA